MKNAYTKEKQGGSLNSSVTDFLGICSSLSLLLLLLVIHLFLLLLHPLYPCMSVSLASPILLPSLHPVKNPYTKATIWQNIR
jgi:hypothetical protein